MAQVTSRCGHEQWTDHGEYKLLIVVRTGQCLGRASISMSGER